MAEEEMVTITKKLLDWLSERESWLCELEAAGVDNWSGYEVAQEAHEDDN